MSRGLNSVNILHYFEWKYCYKYAFITNTAQYLFISLSIVLYWVLSLLIIVVINLNPTDIGFQIVIYYRNIMKSKHNFDDKLSELLRNNAINETLI